MEDKDSKNEYLNNVNVDPQFIGLTGLLNPFNSHASASRLDMFASHISQFRIPEQGESPDIFTGYESVFADYCFDTTQRRNDVKILAIIPKYQMSVGMTQIRNNPMVTVVYKDMDTGELGYFNLNKFTKCSDGYGYRNVGKNLSSLVEGAILEKDTKLYESVAHKDGEYCFGANANVAFITLPETVEDAFVISESLAKRLSPLDISTVSMSIDLNKYPLNLYGDQDEYRIFPDIGDHVREDGVICAFRNVEDFSIVSDLNINRLSTINHLHDSCIYGHPGAQVIDIDVHLGDSSKVPKLVFDQIKKYNEAKLNYYKTILDLVEEHKDCSMDGKFNTLVTRAISMMLVAKRRVKGVAMKSTVKLAGKHSAINLMVDIIMAHPVHINLGFKSTGREGGKGTISAIKPDDEMPVDEQGFRADICIDPMAVIKRTNISQLFEQFINRTLKLTSMRLAAVPDMDTKFNMIHEILNDINPNFAALVKGVCMDMNVRKKYVEYCEKNTIKVNISPTLNTIGSDLVLNLNEKYKADASRVSFVIEDEKGNKKRITTKNPVMIGSKFIMLLYKYPKAAASGFGFISQYHVPIKSNRKHIYPISRTPVRFGEDEFRIMAGSIGTETACRMRSMLGTSDAGREALMQAILKAKYPSRIGRVAITNEQLQDDDFMLGVVDNMFCTTGVDMKNVKITQEVANEMFRLFEDC